MWQVTILKVISSFFNTFSTLPSSDSWRLMCAHARSLVRSFIRARFCPRMWNVSTMLSPHTHSPAGAHFLLELRTFGYRWILFGVWNSPTTVHSTQQFYVPRSPGKQRTKIERMNIVRNIFFTRYFSRCEWSSRHDYDGTRNYRKLFILKYTHRPVSAFNIISTPSVFVCKRSLSQSKSNLPTSTVIICTESTGRTMKEGTTTRFNSVRSQWIHSSISSPSLQHTHAHIHLL